MKSVQVSELREKLDETIEAVKKGEVVQISEGKSPIATIQPHRTIEETIEQLAKEGVVRRGTGKLPPDFLTRELPKFDGSVVEQLLEDRRKNDW
jgi:antitoxin (DNA-binding transcriptional repressor) of toxin-antitoxin stability system